MLPVPVGYLCLPIIHKFLIKPMFIKFIFERTRVLSVERGRPICPIAAVCTVVEILTYNWVSTLDLDL